MKIQSTFTVILEADDENAEFVFKKPKANDILAARLETPNDLKSNFHMLTNDLVSVKGLYDEAGGEITAESIRSLDLDLITISAIIEGYNQAAYPKAKVDQEKKTF